LNRIITSTASHPGTGDDRGHHRRDDLQRVTSHRTRADREDDGAHRAHRADARDRVHATTGDDDAWCALDDDDATAEDIIVVVVNGVVVRGFAHGAEGEGVVVVE
jgi:hypothetical protein